MIVCIGMELSADVDAAAIAIAGQEGPRWSVDMSFYGDPEKAVAEAVRLYLATENCGLYVDPMPSAGSWTSCAGRGCG